MILKWQLITNTDLWVSSFFQSTYKKYCYPNKRIKRFLDSFQSYNKQQQQQFQTITRSPDSKRFKWESLNAEPAEMKSSKKVFDFLAGKYSQLEREDTERIGNSFYLELQQPVVLKSDCAEANSLLTLDAKSPSSMSNSIILNVKNNEISKYQTV